jgi:hypothetical protein
LLDGDGEDDGDGVHWWWSDEPEWDDEPESWWHPEPEESWFQARAVPANGPSRMAATVRTPAERV